MAKVNFIPKITKEVITRTVVVEQDEEFILRLSRKEAEALAQVCCAIGGEPNGPRGIFSTNRDSILEQLRRAGVDQSNHALAERLNAIYFAK